MNTDEAYLAGYRQAMRDIFSDDWEAAREARYAYIDLCIWGED